MRINKGYIEGRNINEGYIEGRNINEANRYIQDIIGYTDTENKERLMVVLQPRRVLDANGI